MVRRRTGCTSYRVVGTVRGERRDKQFDTLADAQATVDAWETERLGGGSALRARVTRLAQDQLKQAEAIFELCSDTGRSPKELILWALKNAPDVKPQKPYAEAARAFLDHKAKQGISTAQLENLTLAVTGFGIFLGEGTNLSDVTAERGTAWLEGRGLSKKTWNNYRNDLSSFVAWCVAKPQQWLAENPIECVLRYRKRDLPKPPPGILSVKTCRDLMAYLEAHHPEWCAYFAIALFAGVRPDLTDGEMQRVSRKVEQHGVDSVYRNGKLYFTADLTKDGRARETTVYSNLAEWLEMYPPTPAALAGGGYYRYGKIREKFQIPHDGLRHTTFSAFVACKGTITQATLDFGNSEDVARNNYIGRMLPAEGEEFYSIRPTGKEPWRPAKGRETRVRPPRSKIGKSTRSFLNRTLGLGSIPRITSTSDASLASVRTSSRRLQKQDIM